MYTPQEWRAAVIAALAASVSGFFLYRMFMRMEANAASDDSGSGAWLLKDMLIAATLLLLAIYEIKEVAAPLFDK